MSSIAMEKEESSLPPATVSQEAVPAPLKCWLALSVSEQAFVAAYVENGYSLAATSEALAVPTSLLQKILNKPDVRRAITEVQAELDSIDFLNEKWVKTQLLRLFPKVMGEEAIPFVNNFGEEVTARKFYPDIAMRVLEYVAPKTVAGKAAGNLTAVQVNIDMGAMGIQRVQVSGANGG